MSSGVSGEQAALEQRVNEMMQQARVLEAQLNEIIAREAAISRLLEEARLASTAVQEVQSESEVESYIPIGIGVHMRVSVPPVKKLLINIGAGVAVEKSRDDTINYIESRLKEFEIALKQLMDQKQQVSLRMQQIQVQVNEMVRRATSSRSDLGKQQ
ncbi:MAG TPA: prefoldin subunit alpha [Nitrososphaeraceae archaeon]|jgi:prefoldin alpha subunit|nr:prefoldin subunit alpha [Nitrososphaeraceae archaeon]